ncbi:hypothetical protein Bcsk_001300 [Bartonella sp. CDC_skunk]|uniref:Uncharacterized protein n=1 Tax=Bartonella rochalimae ATCC BAA-1498 TaxID=685782 RepID=A0A067WEP4_9HYPH|nr:hypothetical protein BA1379B_000230 [Bartonella sp. A1379B]AQX20795.1 hypothetical protein Bcsk_001300 [Bartonella sp. CDC_skunk]AQX22387.1 hypothetical protein Bho11B_003600 [Bartonella sp. 11B]AQX24330.1 hypothetical protein Bho114_010160 [Bartonella sp. 114]AQX24835.1 hypothetical protein Bco22_001330 [Bartonella sp. Coyote22sub2]AQX26049.1 hypothetical protein Bra60_000220 [Bartonella sp. Raccoon60]KEC57416.1 hypothetical protein O99_00064 [Bartonella rochalimae ATCC BAA-1498]
MTDQMETPGNLAHDSSLVFDYEQYIKVKE